MNGRTVGIPAVLHVEDGALARSGPLLASSFDVSRVLIGFGCGPSEAFALVVAKSLREAGAEVALVGSLAGDVSQAEDLVAELSVPEPTLFLGVGGGRAIDTLKLAASRAGAPFISVPTTIAHDGISSPVAALTSEGRRRSHAATMPAGVIVDLGVIASAPARTLLAGVGDLQSNLTAILDWQLAERAGQASFDAFAAMIAEAAANSALDLRSLAHRRDQEVLA